MVPPQHAETSFDPCSDLARDGVTSTADLEREADAAYESARAFHLESQEARWWLGRILQHRRDLELLAQYPLLARFTQGVHERVNDFAVLAAEREGGTDWSAVSSLPRVRALEMETAREAQHLHAMQVDSEARWASLDAQLERAREAGALAQGS